MAKPRKSTSDTFYDCFASWSADDRVIALKVLEQTHRQLLRVELRSQLPKNDAVASSVSAELRHSSNCAIKQGLLCDCEER